MGVVLGSGLAARLRPHIGSLVPGLVCVALMLDWAIQNGGYDDSTWLWGALVVLSALSLTLWLRRDSLRLSRTTLVALGAFALYVAWSYLSITWAESKGDALDGSNRALLYLLLFALLAVLPWTPGAALAALVTFVLGIGAVAIVLLLRLASGDHVSALVIGGRLAAPTGYFNATAALFTIASLVAIALAARRELPSELRGALLAAAAAGLQLAVIVQSRGWLFTLPLVALVAIAVVRDRIRFVAAAALPVIAVLVVIKRLLDVFKASNSTNALLRHSAERAGTAALVLCGVVLLLGTLLGAMETLRKRPPLSAGARRWVGTALAVFAIAGAAAGGTVATHGHPLRFIERQWNGFSHAQTNYSSQSHFLDVGSGRYDFWRVALDAFVAHPIGGLGQDNYGDYYLLHGRTGEQPSWPHSIELRLLACTGIVGFALFAVFLVAALRAAFRARGRDGMTATVAGAALLPLVVWLIHGSVDWFWEMPALSGPSLGFLAMATALGEQHRGFLMSVEPSGPVRARWKPVAVAVPLFLVCVTVLGFSYLSAREVSLGSSIASSNPHAALDDLKLGADFNPLSSIAGRLAGTVALHAHDYALAERRFEQSLANQPEGWFSWLGAGLAASALGQRTIAHRDFVNADRIESRQPAVTTALRRVYSAHPLNPSTALNMIVVVQ
jgi:O-Antigen ligase